MTRAARRYAGADPANEDDFSGYVTYGPGLPSNPLPRVSLSGPSSGAPGELLTFTASASDDESIANYSFDLDGDGFFETNRLGRTPLRSGSAPATTTSASA